MRIGGKECKNCINNGENLNLFKLKSLHLKKKLKIKNLFKITILATFYKSVTNMQKFLLSIK